LAQENFRKADHAKWVATELSWGATANGGPFTPIGAVATAGAVAMYAESYYDEQQARAAEGFRAKFLEDAIAIRRQIDLLRQGRAKGVRVTRLVDVGEVEVVSGWTPWKYTFVNSNVAAGTTLFKVYPLIQFPLGPLPNPASMP
jgi:hypothetical protein